MVEIFIRDIMEKQHIPGLAVAVKQRDEMLLESYDGYANLEHRVSVSSKTIFEIASITKLFTTQAVLLLVQNNRIKLEDSIADYLDNLPTDWHRISLQHILAHQSGIPSYTNVDEYWKITRLDKSPDEILALVRDQALKFEPGSLFAYDNTGFYLLGMIIEVVSGMTYGAYLEEHIFHPLGMINTQVNSDDLIIHHRAQGYVYQEDRLINKPFYSTTNTFSAGVLLSTIPDLLSWQSSWFDSSVLQRTWLEQWWLPHPSVQGNERQLGHTVCLGWFKVDSPLGQFLGHNGGISGFASSCLYFPDSAITAFVLCNAGHVTEPHKIALDIVKEVMS